MNMLIAGLAALSLLATPVPTETPKNNDEAYIGLFFGASLAALLVISATEDEAESD